MYRVKFIIGQMVWYKSTRHKIEGIRFTAGGVLYKLSGIKDWLKESKIIKN